MWWCALWVVNSSRVRTQWHESSQSSMSIPKYVLCVAMFLFAFVAYQKWPLLEYFDVDDDDFSAMVVATVLAWPDTVAVLLVLATTSNK